MSFAVDLSLLVDFVAAGRDDFRLQRQVATGNTDTIELQFQISLVLEVAGIFGVFEMANQIASVREREVKLIQRALQQSAGGNDHVARAGAHSECAKGYRQKGEQ